MIRSTHPIVPVLVPSWRILATWPCLHLIICHLLVFQFLATELHRIEVAGLHQDLRRMNAKEMLDFWFPTSYKNSPKDPHSYTYIYIYSNTIHTYLYIYRQQSGLHFKPAPRPASGFTCSVFTSAVMPETPPAAIVLIRVVFPAPLRPTCGHWAGSGAKL